MIIFNLDGTLANCEHRRHFVTPPDDAGDENYDVYFSPNYEPRDRRNRQIFKHKLTDEIWKPNWKEFNEACNQDKQIEPVMFLIYRLIRNGENVHIWSGRDESVRDKTITWLNRYLEVDEWFYPNCLKMRPIGDLTPDDQLKERWLDEALAEGKTIDFVVDGNPESVRMLRKRGIFVFDVNQK